jgi:hypothetical protein
LNSARAKCYSATRSGFDSSDRLQESQLRRSRTAPCPFALLLISAALCVATESRTSPQAAETILADYPPEIVRRLYDRKTTLLPKPADESIYIGALVLFDQPLDRTQRLLSQTSRQHEYLPELKAAETIRWDGKAVINEHHVRVMLIRLEYRIRTEFDFDAGRIWWALDPSHQNDLDVLEGYWELYEMDGSQTLGRFKTRVVLSTALPRFLQDAATRINLPRAMERIRLWVNSEGTYRP